MHTLFAIDFHSYYPLAVAEIGQESENFARFDPELGLLHIHLKHAGLRLPVFYGQSSVSISGCQNKMIDCAQIRLELLRHHVRQNHQDNLPAAQEPLYGPIASAFHNPTRVALFQLTNTNRPLQMSRFTVIPVPASQQNVSAGKVEKKNANNKMLHVKVNDDAKPEQKSENNCSGSPSDSTDSGMPSSPPFLTTDDDEDTLSPLPSSHPVISASNRFHFNATTHPMQIDQPQFRSRSASESLDFRQSPTLSSSTKTLTGSVSSNSSSLSPNGTPLRSILKKPKLLAPGLGNTCLIATSTNGARRAPTRYVLARSISECHDEQMFIGDEFQFGEDEVISMEDLTVAGGNPLSVCAEVDEETYDSNDSDEPTKPTAEQQRKKRVSFNEQVQARIYRSNSSILATRNKQERKLRNRMRRRAESESDQQSLSVDELLRIPTIPLQKLSAEEKLEGEDSEENTAADKKELPPLNERRDSGFDSNDSNDSGMDSPPQEAMQVDTSSPKKVQRIVSADSAYEELME